MRKFCKSLPTKFFQVSKLDEPMLTEMATELNLAISKLLSEVKSGDTVEYITVRWMNVLSKFDNPDGGRGYWMVYASKIKPDEILAVQTSS